MNDLVMTIAVMVILSVGTAIASRRVPEELRTWVWLGFAEYMGCCAAQQIWTQYVIEGGDTLLYTQRGAILTKYLDLSFSYAGPEVLNMLLQQPSAFDNVRGIIGAGSNTGSMVAAAGFLQYFFNGSATAAQFVTAGASFFAALMLFKALHERQPDLNAKHVFLATVLFPSIAFWTSAILKEAFCSMGIGLVLGCWRYLYAQKYVRALLVGPLGLLLIALFRAPTIPPLALGIALYFVYDRLRKARGSDVVVLGPLYLAVGIFLVVGGLILLSQIDPSLGIDRIGDTMARKQALWASAQGGSNIDDEEDVAPATPLEQLSHVPLALVNALFRPQLFDVHNLPTLVSALEMTFVTYHLVRTVWKTGIRGVLTEIERSPLLLMSTVIAFVGCAFVGLVTYNLGSLARYRVPYLPFYAMFIVFLYRRTQNPLHVVAAPAAAKATTVPVPAVARGGRRSA